MIKAWLKAGILEDGSFHETIKGTPQGGVASPLLMNIALHGIEMGIRGAF
jgi:RNA-directed DNA polymerase